MSTPMLAAAIVLSAAITFGLRALPFLIFSGDRKMPGWLQKLGGTASFGNYGGSDYLLSEGCTR